MKIVERLKGSELTPEQKVEKYAELLLADADGRERTAIGERLMRQGAEGDRHRSAQARFFRKEGGYYMEEYRDGAEAPSFVTYMMPPETMYQPEEIPAGAKWATGMIRCHWERFSIHDFDDVEPVAHVLKHFFGELPQE